ncbi:MAG TPA: phospholipid carrier-dependent glycosyltransferase [bacterium]|nr:phospholipid carrier-dependent glycosyltransferase [bacterium]
MQETNSHRWIWPLLAGILLASFFINVLVIAHDEVPDIYDTLNMEVRGKLLTYGLLGDREALDRSLQYTIDIDYPLVFHFITLPVRLVAGDRVRAGAVTVAALSTLLLLVVFWLGRFLVDERVGLLAALLLAVTPGIYRFSRMEMLDIPLALIVAAVMLAMLYSGGLAVRRWSILFGLGCGLGLMVKQSFPFYVILPLTYVFVRGLLKEGPAKRRQRLLNGLMAAVIVTVVGVVFYLPHLLESLESRMAILSFTAQKVEVGSLDFFRLVMRYGLGPVLAVLVVAALAVLPKGDTRYRFLTLWFLAPLIFMPALFGYATTRYLLPVLPAAALLIAWALVQFQVAYRQRKVKLVAGALIVVMAVGFMAYDHLRVDRTAFSFADFHRRLQLEGIARPRRLGWSVDPMINRMIDKQWPNKRVLLLFDTPYAAVIKSRIIMQNPKVDVLNLIERISVGQTTDEAWRSEAGLRESMLSADYIVFKTGYERDHKIVVYALNTEEELVRRAISVFYSVKDKFELIDSYAYPEDTEPVYLYRRVTGDEPG